MCGPVLVQEEKEELRSCMQVWNQRAGWWDDRKRIVAIGALCVRGGAGVRFCNASVEGRKWRCGDKLQRAPVGSEGHVVVERVVGNVVGVPGVLERVECR